MRLEANEIDPQIAQETMTRRPAPRLRRRPAQIAIIAALSLSLPPLLGLFIAMPAAHIVDHLFNNILLTNLIGCFLLFGIWFGGSFFGLRYAFSKRSATHQITAEEMTVRFPQMKLSRAERLYCDTLLMLAKTDVDVDTEATMRGMLGQLNELLLTSRKLKQQRNALTPLIGTSVLKELQSEYGELGRKLDRTTDAVAKQSILHSLQMCATRIENTQALEQGLERVKAQQEAVCHTIASAQTALARLHVVPEAQTPVVAEEIARSVSQMNQRTYAVEKAVEEVLTLGREID